MWYVQCFRHGISVGHELCQQQRHKFCVRMLNRDVVRNEL